MTRISNTPSFRRASYTAEIVEHTPYDPCASVAERHLLVITDLNGARSVTNDVDNVLLDCLTAYGLDLPSIVIYRDSQGRWDRILHIDGAFRGFAALGETDLQRAIAKATEPVQPRASG
jgi:hypothetical protein